MTVACTEAWAESIMSMLLKRDHRGKLLVRYHVDARGRLKTKMPKLLEMIADAMVYPPACDDVARRDPRSGAYHVGSKMRACCCEQCTRMNDDKPRHVYWPANYMVKEHLSYTCSVNRVAVDPDLLEAIDPHAELLRDIDGGRVVMPGEVASRMTNDPNAWRHDKLRRLPWIQVWEKLYPDLKEAEHIMESWMTTVIGLLRSHQWQQVVGDWKIDNLNRESSTVRKILRGLNNIGSLADFLELGRSLTDVPKIDKALAAAIAEMVTNYPREPRMRRVRIRWRQLRSGRSK